MASEQVSNTRLLFLGDAVLGEGFRLIGFEVHADPTRERMEQLLGQLLDAKQSAYLVVDQPIAEQRSPMLERIRAEGGRIVVSGVPPLNNPSGFQGALDSRIQTLLNGAAALEEH